MPPLSALPIDAELVSSLPGPPGLKAARTEAWDRFRERELPTEAEEIWRYSRIDELALERYTPASGGAERSLAELPAPLRELASALGPDVTVVVTGNDGPARVEGPGAAGLDIGVPEAALFADGRPAGGAGGPPPDVWADLNGALCAYPLRLRVQAGAEIPGPVLVAHWLEGKDVAFFPRLEIEVGPQAHATVVEVMASAPGNLLVVPLTQISLAEGAGLGFLYAQLLAPDAWQLGSQVSRCERDSRLRSMTFALGGEYARVRADSVLAGPGAESQLLAAYFGAGAQMHDLRTVQHHAAPQCRSDLLFKGAVANESRSAYSGLIRVEKGAKGTNAFQTNRNLVLSEGAEAYSVPNLEIEDNDVRCSHASAVGPVDEAQLFYLESRGVPSHAAERLVALGFVDDVLERSPAPQLLAWSRGQLAAKLATAGFGGGGR